MGLTLKGQESMWYAFSWIQALFPPLEEKDEVVPLERSLPVLSTPIHLFEAALFTQLSGWHRDIQHFGIKIRSRLHAVPDMDDQIARVQLSAVVQYLVACLS